MANNNNCATLAEIRLTEGNLRGLYPFEINFSYPLSVVAGANGTGKSTLLAIAACAFHNKSNGYHLKDRSRPYYTFSDFFIQTNEEIPPSGIKIYYGIRHDGWKSGKKGVGWQSRTKKLGGRWKNYDSRIKRNVIYFGIQRVVPHYEIRVHRSNHRKFLPGNTLQEKEREKIREIASRILNKNYTSFELHEHLNYRLPAVTQSRIYYSGFNMGAGESAVFNILTALFEAGKGTLLIIDEIELGLHEQAQKCFIDELKKLCLELHCQIICSTHSSVVLEALPPEARFYIESQNGKTIVIPEIAAAFACGKLAGTNSAELNIFVEDDIGMAILPEILPLQMRRRVKLFKIGSSEAILRHIASRYREKAENFIVFLDGDKRAEKTMAVNKIRKFLEDQYHCPSSEIDSWISSRLNYLPGDVWPEKWLINEAIEFEDFCGLPQLEEQWGLEKGQLKVILEEALIAGKHNEFHSLASSLHYDKQKTLVELINHINKTGPSLFSSIIQDIEKHIQQCAI